MNERIRKCMAKTPKARQTNKCDQKRGMGETNENKDKRGRFGKKGGIQEKMEINPYESKIMECVWASNQWNVWASEQHRCHGEMQEGKKGGRQAQANERKLAGNKKSQRMDDDDTTGPWGELTEKEFRDEFSDVEGGGLRLPRRKSSWGKG